MTAQFLVVAIAALSVAQTPGRPITGLWSAEFEGRTFIRLELQAVDGAVAGGISLGNFEVDSQGVVKRADAAPPNLTPIFDVTPSGTVVTFFRKDGNDTDQFVLRVRDDASADLEFLLNDEDRQELAASGVPPPKPIRLRKAG